MSRTPLSSSVSRACSAGTPAEMSPTYLLYDLDVPGEGGVHDRRLVRPAPDFEYPAWLYAGCAFACAHLRPDW